MKRLLAILFSFSLTTFFMPNSAQASVIQSGLVLDLEASDPSSNPASTSSWKDISGYGNDATLSGASVTNDGPAFTGTSNTNSIKFASTQNSNQTTGYGSVSNTSNSLDTWTSGITISAWVEFDTPTGGNTGSWARLIDFGNASASSNILIGRTGTNANDFVLETWVGGTSNGYCTLTGGVENGVWKYYTVTLDGTNCIIYKNGTQQQSISYTGKPGTTHRTINYIGRSNWSNDASLQARVNSLQIYNRALSLSEIQQNYYQTNIYSNNFSSTTTNKRSSTTITTTLSSPGTVTYKESGRNIPGCVNKPTTFSSSATGYLLQTSCTWKPIIHGQHYVATTFTPYASFQNSGSSTQLVLVKARTVSR